MSYGVQKSFADTATLLFLPLVPLLKRKALKEISLGRIQCTQTAMLLSYLRKNDSRLQ